MVPVACTRSSRQLGLAAFFLLCIVPTAAVLGWCIAWRLPWYAGSEAAGLGRELGLTVAIQGLRHPRPGTVVYEGLVLSDPESGRWILRCPRLEAAWTTIAAAGPSPGKAAPGRAARPAIALTAAAVEIDADGCGRLEQLVGRCLQGQGGPGLELRLTAAEVKLFDRQRLWRLHGLEGGLGACGCGCQAQAAFRLTDKPEGDSPIFAASMPQKSGQSPGSEPIRLRVVRNRQVTPPAGGLELSTGRSELPLALLAIGLPELRRLGPGCRFSGYGWANQGSDGWDGELTGQLLELDLGQLLGPFGQRLMGHADLAIQRAKVHGGRLAEATGTLAGGPGRIGRPLVDAAIEHLRLVRPPPATAWTEVLPYDCLALAFQLDEQGLRLAGRCPGPDPGTILLAAGGPLVCQPAEGSQPVVALVRALAPAGSALLPASPQTDWLRRYLPFAEGRAAPATAAAVEPGPAPAHFTR